MPQTEQQLRQDMVRIGRMMSEKGWIAACDGNLSARLTPGRILVTPAGACKGLLQEDDPIVCNLDGKRIEGHGKPTSEIHMHLTIYQMREDVRCGGSRASADSHRVRGGGQGAESGAAAGGDRGTRLRSPGRRMGHPALRHWAKACSRMSNITTPCCWPIMARWHGEKS